MVGLTTLNFGLLALWVAIFNDFSLMYNDESVGVGNKVISLSEDHQYLTLPRSPKKNPDSRSSSSLSD
jgi:hypothetical protein